MPEYQIRALGRQGDGIADGPIFVPRALPGETVSGRLAGDRLEDVRILAPSDRRVAPPCRHFKTCGGCQMQHASNELVAEWKREIVESALRALGLEAPIRGVETSPARARRRAGFSARRTKSGAMAGFHARGSDTLVDVSDCPVISPALSRGLDLARALAVEGASRKAELTVRCTETPDGLDVMVEGGKPLDQVLELALPGITSAHGVVRLVWSGELVLQGAPPRHRMGRAEVALPAGAFLQATAHGEAVLQSCMREATQGASRIADLFAGCGTFALTLADSAPVLAVEGDKAMVRALQEAANTAGLTYPVTARQRDLFADPLTAAELARFDAVVLDPPRAGAKEQVAEIALVRSGDLRARRPHIDRGGLPP